MSERFDPAQISAGENRPGLNVDADGLDAILVLLHQKSALSEIKRRLGLDDASLLERLSRLEAEGLARKDADGVWRPAFPVISIDDAKRDFVVPDELVSATVERIETALAEIRADYIEIEGLRGYPFDRASLFILSNVLLDNFQIDAVEREFLGAPRPQRGGGRYYFTLYEREAGSDLDTMGIYGNHFDSYGDLLVGLYGNRRYKGDPNLATASRAELSARCGFAENVSAGEASAELARALVGLSKNSDTDVPARQVECLEWLRLIDASGALAIPVLSEDDWAALQAIADGFAPDLLALLESRRGALRAAFDATSYAEEGVAFEEWFIWWYHFFYTAATDRMIAEGIVEAAPSGVFTYIVRLGE